MFLPLFLQAQIPNSGFEEWTTMGSYSNPNQWGTLNDLTAPAGGVTCTKGTPGYPGTAYLKLITTTVSGMGIMPGIAVSGVLNTTTMQPVSGFPYTGRPESLEGHWQFMAYLYDQGYISILLSRWNSLLHQRDTIAYAYQALPGMVMSWKSFSIPLNYQSGSAPDSAIITASASNATGAVISDYSYLYLDNLAFTGSTAGIVDHRNDKAVEVYPNPVKQTLYIKLSAGQAGPVTVEIFSVAGQRVSSSEYTSSSGPMFIDVSHFQEGCYLIKITSGQEVYYQRFIRRG